MKFSISLVLLLCMAAAVRGDIVTETVAYTHGDVDLEGFLAWDESIDGQRPGVLVVHEWTGLNDYTKSRCRQLAELGYVAFAVDMYGKGIRPQTRDEASRQAAIYRSVDRSGDLAPTDRALPLPILDHIVVKIGHVGPAYDKNILAGRLAGQRLD